MASKPTIKDVARRAGVSLGTVSRVLNGSGYFDEDTGRKVRDAVAELGYRKNVHWRRLSANSSRTLCFLLGNRAALNTMQMKMLVACERVCNERGYDLVFSRFEYASSTRGQALELPRILADQGVVDGVILIGRHSPNLLETFDRSGVPWVLLGNNYEGDLHRLKSNAVSYDDEVGCFEATSYLIRQGHRRIAFIGNVALPWFERRRKGYDRAMQEHKLRPRAFTAAWDMSGVEHGRLAAAELLRDSQAPTAILASNDELAAGVWKELIHRRVRIPAEISLCGFGDREEFQILEPSLTSMAVFPDRLGAELAQMIFERIANPEAVIPSRMFPCRMVERHSCAPPPSRVAVVRV